jgi:hypothetical protein
MNETKKGQFEDADISAPDIYDETETLSGISENVLSDAAGAALSDIAEAVLSDVSEAALSDVSEAALSPVVENIFEGALSDVFEEILSVDADADDLSEDFEGDDFEGDGLSDGSTEDAAAGRVYENEDLTLLSPVHQLQTKEGPKKVNLLRVSERRLHELLLNEIAAGSNAVRHNLSISTMEIDDDWIDQVENAIQSMETIMRDPKSFIKEEREVVNIEKVRKVDHQTIRHLSSHTEYVRKVYDDGRVEPTKLLTKFLETELAIYENRVVYTLLQRLKPFIDIRYKAIKDILEQEINDVSMKSKFKFAQIDFDVEMILRAVTPSADRTHMEKNLRLTGKLDNIKKRLSALETTAFCQALKSSKLVTPPLQKTNIFNKNIDYRNCYALWMFISSFTEVGYSVEVSEKNLPVDTTYYQDLSRIIAQSAATVLKTNAIRADAYRQLMYEKKQVKQHKLMRSVRIDHKAPFNLLEDETNLNQFYFEKIKSVIKGAQKEAARQSPDVHKKDINTSFKRLFKGLNRINNEVFLDAIKATEPPPKRAVEQAADETTLGRQIQKKRNQIVADRKLLQKLLLLQQLKEDDLNAARRRVKNHIKRLDQSEIELERKLALKIASDKKRESDKQKKQKEAEKKRVNLEKEKLLKKKKADAAKARAQEAKRKEAALAAQKQKTQAERKKQMLESLPSEAERKKAKTKAVEVNED